MTEPTASTRLFALLGDPVEHSLSPGMWGPAFREAGIDAVYLALRCGPDEVAGLMRGLALAGGGGNVTLPHKARALAAADQATEAARRTGAANTFWAEDDEVWADNTDVDGVRASLDALFPGGVDGRTALLLGAGGAARAALVALLDGGIGRALILNRTPDRARALVDELGDPRLDMADGATEGGVEGAGPVDLVVHATSLGIREGDPLPMDPARLGGGPALLDLVYGSDTAGTPLVQAARAAGLAAIDGREMLIGQGVAAFQRWFGREAPAAAMRRALEGAR